MRKRKSANGCGALAVVIVAAWICLKFIGTMTNPPNSKQWAKFEERRIEPEPNRDTPKQHSASTPIPAKSANTEPSRIKDESEARVMTETFVKRQLSHPSTASFPWFGKTAKRNSDGSWTVTGTVKAKNSFNLETTMKYVCQLKRLDADRWELVDCNLAESDE